MTKFSGGISPLPKESLVLVHLRCDVLEQVDAHLKMPPKIASGNIGFSLKYDRINFSCPSILSLRNFCIPNTDPPIFSFLTVRYANSRDMLSSSSWLYSSSDESDDELYKYTYEMTSLQLASSKKN
jgi:hypothetical protein